MITTQYHSAASLIGNHNCRSTREFPKLNIAGWLALNAAPDELIRIFEPSEINIVVAGGETQGAWKMISGSLRATVSIDAWR